MNNFNWDQFETEEEPPKVIAPASVEEKKVPFNWDEFETIEDEQARENREPEETMTSQVIRHLSQIPSGAAQLFTFPLDIANLVATGESLSELEELEERLPELREKFPFANLPEKIDRKAYMEAIQNAAEAFPTQSNIEAGIEKATGFPLVPKNQLQKLIKFGSGVGVGSQLGALVKEPLKMAKSGLIAAATSGAAQAVGVPEIPAEIIGAGATQLPKAAKAVKQALSGERQAGKLATGMIGGQLNRSTFETAEEALNTLRKPKVQLLTLEKHNPKGETRSVSQKKEGISIRPQTPKAVPETPLELSNAVGDIFSPDIFRNTTEGGQLIKRQLLSDDKQVYKGVNELYNKSEGLNSQINDIHPGLVDNLINQAKEIAPIPQKSTIQERKLKSIENILNALADIDENGNIIGYKPISNQTLIKQTEAINQIVDFDFAHGKPSGIFKPLKSAIDDSIESTAKQSGNLDAYLSWREARKAHADWSQTFDNDTINPFRDTTNQYYSKLFRNTEDLDKMRIINNILDTTPTGKKYADAATRQLVDSKLSKFFDNPAKADKKALEEAIRELEGVIKPSEGDQIRKYFKEYKEPKNFKAKPLTHEYNKPEDVISQFNSRSGIRELKQDLSRTAIGKKQFQDLSKQKVRSILQEGNIKKKFSGNDLYGVINKENNYEILSELLGKEAVDAALEAAEKAGKKQLTTEAISKTAKKAAALKFFHYISPLITIL